jgi:hypothetical protein
MSDVSQFEYPNGGCMFDPVLKLCVSVRTGPQWESILPLRLGVYITNDPEIIRGRYAMLRQFANAAEREIYQRLGALETPVPFRSERRQVVVNVPLYAHDCGDVIRLKVDGNGREFRGYDMRSKIERMNIPLVSSDVSSMYIGVFKAFVRLPALHREFFTPQWFPQARRAEICVTTSALVDGLDRSAGEYPIVENGWHCLASAPRLIGL